MLLTDYFFFLSLAAGALLPNIIWILSDDQDQVLGGSFPQFDGVGPMRKTHEVLELKGTMAHRFYIHTPICNPSRSELLSGRYFHNIKRTAGYPLAMHVDESKVWNYTFLRVLKEQAGYTTGLFGKFMNAMPSYVPLGMDAWMANDGGDYIAPAFQLRNVNGLVPGLKNNTNVDCWEGADHSDDLTYGCFQGTSDPSNYSTALIGNVSLAWIEKVVKKDPKQPFFAYIAPKAAHEPFDPAPWYVDYWDETWPDHEPRPEAWNCSASSRKYHHGTITTQPMITEHAAGIITDIFKNRWRTVMSIDDIIGDVVALCERLGIMDNTYIFFSSDHGFQLGEFNILMDKRQIYEWNTKIPFLARGPGIVAGSSWDDPATQVDLAPTFLGLAGIVRPSYHDGRSILPFLIPKITSDLPAATKAYLQTLPPLKEYRELWRDNVFFEYYFIHSNLKCTTNCVTPKPEQQYPNKDVTCGDLTALNNSNCWGDGWFKPLCNETCYPIETPANNFIAIRTMPWSDYGDSLYAEFQEGNQYHEDIDFSNVSFIEMYDVATDPWQMNNLAYETNTDMSELHRELHAWFQCAGETCF